MAMSDVQTLPRIKRLSSSLANQIAAGEVIERPASVVKELLENSLDAGATRIVVEVKQAGSELIRIRDNGHGIHADDLHLALQRHATAKLRDAADLEAIYSLGFRGEALPSISSVAGITITSRTSASAQAMKLSIDPQSGESELLPAAHPQGTTVEVRQLFYNTPARKKFLSSDKTELVHIQEIVRRLALSRFNFSVQLSHNRRNIFACRALDSDARLRVASVMGRNFIKAATAVDHKAGDMRLWGWLGTGELARSSSDRQYLYLNGRMIHDKRLNHAIRLACAESIASGRYPSYVLHLQMDVSGADVNVHPTKHEVRFRRAADVHDFFYASLSTALADAQSGLPALSSAAVSADPTEQAPESPVLTDSAFRAPPLVSEKRQYYRRQASAHQPGLLSASTALGSPLLQLATGFLLTEREQDVLLISLFEARKYLAGVKLQAVANGEELKGRPLLVPVTYEINPQQEQHLERLAGALAPYALQVELTAPGNCRVRTIPHLLADADIAGLLEDILAFDCAALPTTALSAKLVDIMLSHVVDISPPKVSENTLQQLLVELSQSALPTAKPHYPPLWRTLDAASLQSLLTGDG